MSRHLLHPLLHTNPFILVGSSLLSLFLGFEQFGRWLWLLGTLPAMSVKRCLSPSFFCQDMSFMPNPVQQFHLLVKMHTSNPRRFRAKGVFLDALQLTDFAYWKSLSCLFLSSDNNALVAGILIVSSCTSQVLTKN